MKWQESYKNGLRSIEQVNNFFDLQLKKTSYDILIPLHLANRIKKQGVNGVLGLQFLPSDKELSKNGLSDPIGDKTHFKSPQIIHRYENRLLFLPTKICPVICRYCFRKNSLSGNDEIYDSEFDKTLEYLKSHKEVQEVIFSGGDPLMLPTKKLCFYLEEFSKIEHIKYIRIHTRTPVSLPGRIDEELLQALTKYAAKFIAFHIAIHVNHAQELDECARASILALRDVHRLNLISQSVLLKGINDNAQTLEELFNSFAHLGIRPYYLHHPDQVQGGTHFQLDIEQGRKIYASLRNRLPGWLLPTYILDIPNGEGKTPIYNPESIDFSGKLMNLNQEFISL